MILQKTSSSPIAWLISIAILLRIFLVHGHVQPAQDDQELDDPVNLEIYIEDIPKDMQNLDKDFELQLDSTNIFSNDMDLFGSGSGMIDLIDFEIINTHNFNLQVINTTSTSIVVEWDTAPDVDIIVYLVTYNATQLPEGVSVPGGSHEAQPGIRQVTLTDLEENVNYMIGLDVAFAGSLDGNHFVARSLVNATTNESAPTGPPINVMVVEMTSTTATLAFSPPQYLDQNGRITLYILSYFKEGEEPRQLINRTYPSLGRAVERVTIMNLDPDSVYLYTITAVNSAGIGVPSFEKRFRTLRAPIVLPANVMVEFMSPVYEVSELDGKVDISVTIKGDPLLPVNITIATTRIGTMREATAFDDFGAVQYNISVQPNTELILNLTFPIFDDNMAEHCEEVFMVQTSGVGGAHVTGNSSAEVIIKDNDKPVVRFVGSPYMVMEGDGMLMALLQISNLADDVTMEIEVKVHSTMISDVFQPSTINKTISGSLDQLPIAFSLHDNAVYQGLRQGTLQANYKTTRPCINDISSTTGEFTILEDDVVTFEFQFDSYNFTESDTEVALILYRHGDISIPITVSVMSENITAEADSDYILLTEQVEFGIDQFAQNITIRLLGDSIVEEDEMFIIYVMGPDDQLNQNISTAETMVTILNNDVVSVTFQEDTIPATKGEEMVSITVIVTGETDAPIFVTITGSYEGADGFPTFERTIEVNEGINVIPFLVSPDGVYNPNAKWNFQLKVDPSSEKLVSIGMHSQTEIKIHETDTLQLTFTGTTFTADEDNQKVNITVQLLGATAVDVPVNIYPFDLTNVTAPATELKDYISDPLTLTFPGGSSTNTQTKVVTIEITDDDIFEDTESFGLLLNSSIPAVRVEPFNFTRVDIVDDDGVMITLFSEGNQTVEEGTGYLNICIAVSGRREVPITFELFSEEGTATDNVDYESFDYQGTLLADSTNFTVTCQSIKIINDGNVEKDEVFTIRLNLIDPIGRIQMEERQIMVTVMDDDQASPSSTILSTSTTFTSTAGPSSSVFTSTAGPSSSVFTSTTGPSSSVFTSGPSSSVFTSTVGPSATVLPTSSPVPYRVCRLAEQQISPFSSSSPSTPYSLLSTSCEHVAFKASDGSHFVEVFADISKSVTTGFYQYGIKYNRKLILVNENYHITNRGVLGMPLQLIPGGAVYPGNIVLVEGSDGFTLEFQTVGFRIITALNKLEIQLSTLSTLAANVQGLCGDYNGDFLDPDMTDVQVPDREFINSWKVLHFSLPVRTACRQNTSATADPVMTVPLPISRSISQRIRSRRLQLCYEIRGRPNIVFNLVSDHCLSVNALYKGTRSFTYMEKIAILSVDSEGECQEILIDVNGCQTTFNGMVTQSIKAGSVVVQQNRKKIRVSAPNCQPHPTVMWVLCGHVDGHDLLDFVVAKGGRLAPTSHGLIGQFWNVPISIDYLRTTRSGLKLFAVNVTYPDTKSRIFTGELHRISWNQPGIPCLYAGNANGGPVAEYQQNNDPVIMGHYLNYKLPALFDTKYQYSQFNGSCLISGE